jgi:hypothetical protein
MMRFFPQNGATHNIFACEPREEPVGRVIPFTTLVSLVSFVSNVGKMLS